MWLLILVMVSDSSSCRVKKKAQWRAHRAVWSYLTTKRAAVICQRAWRQSVARKELRKLGLV